MKHSEQKSITSYFVTGITCDITGEPCQELTELGTGVPSFDYGVLRYQGAYDSPYDFLDIELELHPDVVVALFLLSQQGKTMMGKDWCYKMPKFKIVVEAQDADQNTD